MVFISQRSRLTKLKKARLKLPPTLYKNIIDLFGEKNQIFSSPSWVACSPKDRVNCIVPEVVQFALNLIRKESLIKARTLFRMENSKWSRKDI